MGEAVQLLFIRQSGSGHAGAAQILCRAVSPPDDRADHSISGFTLSQWASEAKFVTIRVGQVEEPLTTRSSFLLKIQERPRNITSITKPRPEEASVITFSETWPKA